MPTQLITSPNIIIKVLYFFYEKFTQETQCQNHTHTNIHTHKIKIKEFI